MLALLAVQDRLRVEQLVTFVPDPPRPFLAHPLVCMSHQAEALQMKHRCVPVREPLKESYERAIAELAAGGTEVLVTGDMDRVEGHDNWIAERARGLVEVERPLWQADRVATLQKLRSLEMRVVCTLARKSCFDETIAGRALDRALLAELSERHGHEGFDACGENGEYHTCVLDAPGFKYGLRLVGQRVEETGDFCHLCFDSIEPVSKDGR